MATSGINRAAVDILNEGFEVSVSQPSSDAWSLGCDITIEDVDADIREIRLNDIAISGTVAINEASIDIDSERKNVLDLDVNVAIGGVNTSIVESQILTYDDIVKLSSISTAVKNEKGFAASAWSVKKLLDKITPLEGIESISGILVNGIPYTEKNEDGLIDISDAFEGLSGGGGGDADLTNYYTIKQTQNYVKSELAHYVKLEAETQTIKGDIRIDGNLIVSGDTSSGGEGVDVTIGATSVVVDGRVYPAVDGAIDISDAFDNLQEKINLDDYYDKTEVDTIVSVINNNKVDKTDLDKYVLLKSDAQTIEGDIRIKGNLIVEGDTSSGGEGGTTNVGISGIVVNGKEYRDENSDGLVDISKAFEGLDVDVDLSDYYTKDEIDSKGYATTGYVDSKIKGIDLSKYAVKTEVDESILTLNGAITTLDTKYAPTKTWADSLASLIVNEGGNVRIKANLIVNGDTSSGGEGGSTSVGITGILLNGTTYRDENGDGIIDLGVISGGGGLTSVDWDDVQNKPTFGTLAYKNGLTWGEITNVLAGGDEFNIVPSGHNGVFSFNHRAKDGGSATITEYRMRNGGGSYAPVRASSFIVHGGTSSQFLKADGSLDSDSYLSTSGGTLSSTSYQPLVVNSTWEGSSKDVRIALSHGGEVKGIVNWNSSAGLRLYDNIKGNYIGLTADGKPCYNTYEILTSAGGTINGASGALTIARTDADQIGILFKGKSGNLGYLGFGSSGTPAYINTSGTPYTLYHTGNFNPANYLPLSGGTLTSSADGAVLNLTASNNTWVGMRFKASGSAKGGATLFFNSTDWKVTDDGWSNAYTLLHSGNYSDYALPKSGGTISLATFAPLNIQRSASGGAAIAYSGQSSTYGYIGFRDTTAPRWWDTSYKEYTLLHSGNIGSYALEDRGNKGGINFNDVLSDRKSVV